MRRIVALVAIIFAFVMLTGGPTFADASQPVAVGMTGHDAPNATKPQSLATLLPWRPAPSYSILPALKPTPIACRHGGNPCSSDAQCCSGNCHGPVQGWAGWKRYCSPDD